MGVQQACCRTVLGGGGSRRALFPFAVRWNAKMGTQLVHSSFAVSLLERPAGRHGQDAHATFLTKKTGRGSIRLVC